jgi:hypothetical protein
MFFHNCAEHVLRHGVVQLAIFIPDVLELHLHVNKRTLEPSARITRVTPRAPPELASLLWDAYVQAVSLRR